MTRTTWLDEGSPALTLERLVLPNGVTATYASGLGEVASIALGLYDLSVSTSTTNLWTGGAISPGTTWFDTLQTDYEWSEDAEGYNFRHLIPIASVTGGFEGGHVYRAEYAVTTVSFGVQRFVRLFVVRPMVGA